MEKVPIPWQKNDICHDELFSYPLLDYLPLTTRQVALDETEEDDETELQLTQFFDEPV